MNVLSALASFYLAVHAAMTGHYEYALGLLGAAGAWICLYQYRQQFGELK